MQRIRYFGRNYSKGCKRFSILKIYLYNLREGLSGALFVAEERSHKKAGTEARPENCSPKKRGSNLKGHAQTIFYQKFCKVWIVKWIK